MSLAINPALLRLPSDQDASGRSFGEEEKGAVLSALQSGILTSTKGSFVKELEQRFAALIGVRHAIACSSGSAAVHAAVAAIDPEPGDEIVTTAITDMGALAPILYQSAIPVFADVDPLTCNVTAETAAARLSPRTRALIVTHLFGRPCEMTPIMELAARRGIPVIEDGAQAFLAEADGRRVGGIGAIGCFSLQQGKHITTGEGGLVTTDDDALARRIRLFVNKAWGYGDERPDHYFLAPNYRMNELTGAVALAQLGKLEAGVARRIENAHRLTSRLSGVRGILTAPEVPGSRNTYWRYAFHVDPDVLAGGPAAAGRALQRSGVACAPRYIQKPAFECEVFRERRTFGRSGFPFTLARAEALDYSRELFAGTYECLDRVVVLPWNERYESHHVDHVAEAIAEAALSNAGQAC